MQFNNKTINVSYADYDFSSPRIFAKAKAHCPTAKGFDSPAHVATIDDGASACTQFLVLPKDTNQNDPYTTPTNKES